MKLAKNAESSERRNAEFDNRVHSVNFRAGSVDHALRRVHSLPQENNPTLVTLVFFITIARYSLIYFVYKQTVKYSVRSRTKRRMSRN